MENDVDQQQLEWRRDEGDTRPSGGDARASGGDARASGSDAGDARASWDDAGDGINGTDGLSGANGASSCDGGSECDGRSGSPDWWGGWIRSFNEDRLRSITNHVFGHKDAIGDDEEEMGYREEEEEEQEAEDQMKGQMGDEWGTSGRTINKLERYKPNRLQNERERQSENVGDYEEGEGERDRDREREESGKSRGTRTEKREEKELRPRSGDKSGSEQSEGKESSSVGIWRKTLKHITSKLGLNNGVCINKNWNNSVGYMEFDDFEYDENEMPLLLVDESEHNRRFTRRGTVSGNRGASCCDTFCKCLVVTIAFIFVGCLGGLVGYFIACFFDYKGNLKSEPLYQFIGEKFVGNST